MLRSLPTWVRLPRRRRPYTPTLVAPFYWRALVALAMLAVCAFYTYAAAQWAPYPGFDLSANWVVRALDSCEANVSWCAANGEPLQVGDRILVIGDLSHDDAMRDRGQVPFAGYSSGDWAPLTVERAEEVFTVQWRMLGPTPAGQWRRWGEGLFIYLPFWVIGTVLLLFLRPQDRRWRLLILFNYFTAFWLAVGAFSHLQIVYTSPTQRALAWLLVPVYLHVHLVVPSVLFPRMQRVLLPCLYILAAVLALLELLQQAPDGAYNLGLLVAVGGSFALLLVRLLGRFPASARTSVYLMLAGIGLAMGPGLGLAVIPSLFQSPLRDQALANRIAAFAIPLLPAFYLYAVYKPYLGRLEFRFNRLLSLYSFALLYLTALVLALTMAGHLLDGGLTLSTFIAAGFGIAAPFLQRGFLQLIDQAAYGAVPDPQKIVYTFADRMPSALDQEALVTLLAAEILPQFDIRQSALYLLQEDRADLIYQANVAHNEEHEVVEGLQGLMAEAERFRPGQDVAGKPFAWVRLAIPLQAHHEAIGFWLFGQREPDDYYPQHQIALLKTLAKQVAVAVENSLLFREQQQYTVELQQSLDRQQAMQTQLVQAGKLASLGTLVAGITHELNNPLAGIKLFTGNLQAFKQRGQLTDALLIQALADIDQLVDKANHIIRHFRDFSRRSGGEFGAVDLNQPVSDALGMLEQQLRLHNIQVQLALGADLPPVLGDANQLEQVVVNLIGNARDAMVAPSCHNRMLTLRTCAMGGTVVLEVADTGCGIAAEHLDKIFDPFYTTKEIGEGTGLGLSISYGIIKNHGGEISVDSAPGRGTTFHVRLPVCPPASPSTLEPQEQGDEP